MNKPTKTNLEQFDIITDDIRRLRNNSAGVDKTLTTDKLSICGFSWAYSRGYKHVRSVVQTKKRTFSIHSMAPRHWVSWRSDADLGRWSLDQRLTIK